MGALRIACAALVATAVFAGPAAALDRPLLQVNIESRVVEVPRATMTDLGLVRGIASTTLRCPPGRIALSGGGGSETFGVGVVSSTPVGGGLWEVTLANSTAIAVDAIAATICARTIAAPKLRQATGRTELTVPAGEFVGPAFEPGTASVTGTCGPGSVPVGAGFDKGGPIGVTVASSAPSGARGWKVAVRNHSGEEQKLEVAVRCVDGPGDFRIVLVPRIVTTPAATVTQGEFVPGEADGTAKCPAGKVLLGGGFRLADDVFAESVVPVLARVPALGFLFRNGAPTEARSEILIVCSPRILDLGD